MSSNAHAADIILAPSDIKGAEPGSAFYSYPPKIPLDKESNELGLFNGADMAYDIPSSSLNQEDYSNMSTTHNSLAFTTSGYEDTMPLEHVRLYQSATKNESSPYPGFEHSSRVRAWTASTDIDMRPCDSDFFGFDNPRISNAQARNGLWNSVDGAASHINKSSHVPPTNQTSSFHPHKNHTYRSSVTSHPQEPSMGDTLSKRPVINLQTTPQPLHPSNMYEDSRYRDTDLVNSMLDPRTLPLNDPPTLGSLVGDDESQVSDRDHLC